MRMCRCNWSRGLTSCGGDVAVYVFDIDQPSLSTPFNSVLVSVSVLMSSWVHGGDVAVYVFDIN